LWKKNFSENLALILCLAEKSQLGLTVKKSWIGTYINRNTCNML
jgi:hypothetical protein